MAKGNLSTPIFAKLSESILRWDYLPGHRFTEEGLCEEFNVSRSPVREALNMLVENGLIEKKPGHGYSVKLLDFEEINELYDVRLALESYVIELICGTGIDDRKLKELHEFWTDIHARLPDTAKSVAAADEEFHETLAKLTKNKTLANSLKSIDRRIHFVRLADITNEERVRTTCLEHIELLGALRDRDAEHARAVLRKNIDGGRSSVERAIKDALAHAYRARD
ncbi:MAG TPA: GntR family transcriptional regulator [Rectinemataceae bacterium]|nr:GntR family transcriptional regulator [Rectinemataceae bacterium]